MTKVNLFQKELPPFDGSVIDAKYKVLHGKEHTAEEKAAWDSVVAITDDFKSFDKYVFAVPMWNFSIPYRLKNYIDLLVQPGQTFSFSPDEGYKGLVTGKPVFIAYSRGGEYPAGSDYEAFDFQTKYFETILGFIGFTEIKSVVIEPTLMGGPDTAKARLEEALEKAAEAGRSF